MGVNKHVEGNKKYFLGGFQGLKVQCAGFSGKFPEGFRFRNISNRYSVTRIEPKTGFIPWYKYSNAQLKLRFKLFRVFPSVCISMFLIFTNVYSRYLLCLCAAGPACLGLRVRGEFIVWAVSHRVSVMLGCPLGVPLPPQQGSRLQRAADPPQPQSALTEPRGPHGEAAGKQWAEKRGECIREGRMKAGHQPVQENKKRVTERQNKTEPPGCTSNQQNSFYFTSCCYF